MRKKGGEWTAQSIHDDRALGVNSAGVRGEWELAKMAVDSGSIETVICEHIPSSVETKGGPAARRGVEYEVGKAVTMPRVGGIVYLHVVGRSFS